MRGRPAGTAPKVAAVAERLLGRIRAGDYLASDLPSEATIADEHGVSYLTARRAVARLVAEGVLDRQRGGRLVLASPAQRPLMVGWVLATWASFDVLRWQRGLAEAMAGRDAVLRPLQVSGWHDPAVLAMARRVDGMIAYPANWGPPPEAIVAATRLVVVDRASGDARVPSLVPNPPNAVDALCAALRGWGRTRIAWVGDPGMDPVVVERRARWLACAGGGPDLPRDRAAVAAAVRAGACDALLCATMPDALVALRAARDAGARIPDDLAIAVVNDEGLGDSLVPALCAPRSPDLGAWLAGALGWFAGDAWTPPPIPDALTIDRRETA